MTSAKMILSKTMPYILAKLVLGGIPAVISMGVLALWLCFGMETTGYVSVLLFLSWILFSAAITYFFMHYVGYQVKAGHIAVASEAAGADRIPAGQLRWGSRHVNKLYPSCNSYLSAKKMISRAIREVQSSFGRSDSITGRTAIPAVTEALLLRFMRYMDGCCIGWTFFKRKQDMYKSAAEGIAIYAQNRKYLLTNSIKVMTKSIIYAAAVMMVLFLPIGVLFRAMGVNSVFALWLSVLCAWAVKYAVLDSYIMIRTITNFNKAARRVTITPETCREYSKMSDTYYKIWKKTQAARK